MNTQEKEKLSKMLAVTFEQANQGLKDMANSISWLAKIPSKEELEAYSKIGITASSAGKELRSKILKKSNP